MRHYIRRVSRHYIRRVRRHYDYKEGGETLYQKNYWVPGEIKGREVELDPQFSPEESMSREVELDCESWTSFASGRSSTAVQRTLSL